MKEGLRFHASEVMAGDLWHEETERLFLQNDIHEKRWKTELRLIGVMMTLQAEQSN